MEWSFPWAINEGDDKVVANWDAVNQNALALDEFFKYAKSKNVTFMTQPQFAAAYSKLYPKVTPAHYMLFRDIPVQQPVVYVSPGAPIHQGPYPHTFLYFDAECQFAFHQGEPTPKLVYNYQHQAETTNETSYMTEQRIPTITSFDRKKTVGGETWTITVDNPNNYPFPTGFTEWGDFSRKTVGKASANIREAKAIGKELLFIRCDAAAESSTTFTVEVRSYH